MKIIITDATPEDIALVAIAINDLLRSRDITSVSVDVPGIYCWEPANRDETDMGRTLRALRNAADECLNVEITTAV